MNKGNIYFELCRKYLFCILRNVSLKVKKFNEILRQLVQGKLHKFLIQFMKHEKKTLFKTQSSMAY